MVLRMHHCYTMDAFLGESTFGPLPYKQRQATDKVLVSKFTLLFHVHKLSARTMPANAEITYNTKPAMEAVYSTRLHLPVSKHFTEKGLDEHVISMVTNDTPLEISFHSPAVMLMLCFLRKTDTYLLGNWLE